MMNKLGNIIAATMLLVGLVQQNCLATDFDPVAPSATSAVGAGGNNASDVSLAIQQSEELSDGSKHVDVSYTDDAIVIRGTVDSDRDREEIGNIAAKCGCVNIRNEVKVVK